MEIIIDRILQWPVIVQGALGSGLFWLILFIGQKAFAVSSSRYITFSKKRRLNSLQAESIRYKAFIIEDKSISAFLLIGLIYSAMHNLIESLICVFIGLLFHNFIPVFGVIGYLFALYYLFKAADNVRYTNSEIDNKSKVEELMAEITILKNELNKVTAADAKNRAAE
jgi:hypothetical protein